LSNYTSFAVWQLHARCYYSGYTRVVANYWTFYKCRTKIHTYTMLEMSYVSFVAGSLMYYDELRETVKMH
jgi:hypothetical protein